MNRVTAVLLCTFISCAPKVALAAEPTIVVGDTIEISVLGMVDTLKRTTVDENGMISYPLLGLVKAEGLSQEKLRQSLAEQLVNDALFKAPKVSVEIVARPPFYVIGDIAKSGAQPYTPNMTVHTAIALAGGTDFLPEGGINSMRSETARDQVESVAFDFVRHRTHLLRLETELAGRDEVQSERFPGLPISAEVVAKLNALERQDFEARRDEATKEKAFLKVMIAKVRTQLSALIDRRHAQQTTIQERESDLSKFKELAERGVIAQGRVLEEQRSMSMMKSALYDNLAQEAQVNLSLEDYQHRLASIDQSRKLTLIKEVEDAYIAVAASESRLEIAQKLTGARRGGGAASYVILRRNNGAQARLDVNEWAVILPGDMIEVKLGARTEVASH